MFAHVSVGPSAFGGPVGAKRNSKVKKAAAQEELPLSTQPTFAELVDWYVETEAVRLRKGTLKGKRCVLLQAQRALPERPTSEDIRKWLAGRVERRELTGSSAKQTLKALGRMYRLARDLRYPGLLNVVARVPSFPVVKQTPKALPSPETDWPKCLAACEDVTEQAYLSVMRRMGLRPGEARALEPRHINLAEGTLSIEQTRHPDVAVPGPLKTDTSAATKRLHPETAELLRQVLAVHRARAKGVRVVGAPERRGEAARRYLFPYFREHEKRLMERLRAAVPEAFTRRERGGRGGAGLHCLRHTFATAADRAGMSQAALQVAMRHKNPATTAVYLDSIRGRREPVEELERVWAEEAAREEAARASSRVTSESRGNTTGSELTGVSRRKGEAK